MTVLLLLVLLVMLLCLQPKAHVCLEWSSKSPTQIEELPVLNEKRQLLLHWAETLDCNSLVMYPPAAMLSGMHAVTVGYMVNRLDGSTVNIHLLVKGLRW